MAPDGPTPEELPHVLRDIQLEYTKEIGGLQVLYEDQWIDVPPVPGALVVNIGDMLQLITNDKFKSVEHRVLANTEGPRVSVASFFTTAGSIASMVTAPNFFSITAFCYLIASMGLQIVWSFALAVLDGTALVKRKALHNSVLVSLFVIGDWHLPRQALPYCTSMTWEIVDLEKNAKNISCRSPWRSLVG
ncbi:hypothetical protein V6N13_054596 [Hibiscus sabdariffa]